MRRTLTTVAAVLACAYCFGQGGGFGGGGQGGGQGGGFGGQGGGFGGQQGGKQRGILREVQDAVGQIDNEINGYLGTEEIKSILTPGEFCEWTFKLKTGQVVIADARSDAFDPAIQMVDAKGKVLASNDDRYLGDQRPLLLWRCPKDGPYALHVRCFHDKSGGEAFVRFKVYNVIDLLTDAKVDQEIDTRSSILVRIPMKAGQVKEVASENGGEKHYLQLRGQQVISPIGLPDINLSQSIQQASVNSVLVAPVAGDYYLVASTYGQEKGRVMVWTREMKPMSLTKGIDGSTAVAPMQVPVLTELQVKKGQLLEVSAPELLPDCVLYVTEVPDVSKNDLAKDETNPFTPESRKARTQYVEPAYLPLNARARDTRYAVFYALRDAKLWIASNGRGNGTKTFAINVKEAAQDYGEDKANKGLLRIGKTDYWAFDANAGDVLTLNSTAKGFSEDLLVRDPDMREIRRYVAGVDQTSDDWRMVVQKPGRYVVAVSCMGDGGGGDYSLFRKALHATTFDMNSPAKGDLSPGDVQIWKFTAQPDVPLLVHWNSSGWSYGVSIIDEKGQPNDIQRQMVDGQNQFGLLKVNVPQTFVIVLTGNASKVSYSIELAPIPGYGAKPKLASVDTKTHS